MKGRERERCVNGLAFLLVPEDLSLFVFEVEPQSQRKKIKGPVIHIPCQDDAVKYHKGVHTPSVCFCVTTVMLA